MNAITRATFVRWAENQEWLLTAELATPNGHQNTYLTPAGNLTIALFDIKGNLLGIGQPVPGPQAPLGKLQKP